ncbi:zinc dependent phospholipase C family protein [Hymenobacter jejuensis]|uniref:Zinc dependent phospholipase C family protein n=1 Tax=Hymenobacter jejuensis TaxID=2502781 RepID=A0A5B7ZX85_9BACT|nr:zinc dependent phospholipase C family protein [Hymenobacter jejuensis]QDA59225.1 zinc dependent phospholipase C family protein [Hymenobacter jejuensis]
MLKWLFLSFVALCFLPASAAGYSVLTHQANVDSCWRRCLVPLLTQRYPGATPEQWKEAKSYAYGGSIIQDMGFYPFGSKLFTNLTHYVRSGDFVRNLLDEAQDRNEYAFALGAMAHYVADIKGHSEGTNRAMPSVYPELAAKYGDVITYFEAPKQHTQLEFAFDVVQLAAGRYRSDNYHDFIGFQVSKPVLERAFQKTYGLELGQVVLNVDVSIGSFRFAVQQLIPTAARAAWHAERKNIRKLDPQARRRDYVYRQSERKFRREYGVKYEKPGFGARLASKFIGILPKIGPLKPFAFRLPTPKAEAYFKKSFADVMADYCQILEREKANTTASAKPLPNYDFDTGHTTRAGEYGLADETYGEWLRKLADKKFEGISLPQQQDIVQFFGDTSRQPVNEDEKKAKTQAETREALKQLRQLTLVPNESPAKSTP